MAVGSYRGVSGVARNIEKRYRGVDGVARNVKKRWRGVSGVARLTFQDGLTLYDNGIARNGLKATGNGTVMFGTDAVSFSGTKDYILSADAIDYTKYSTLNITMKITSGSSSAKALIVKHKYGELATASYSSFTYNTEHTRTLSLDGVHENGGSKFNLALIGAASTEWGSTEYALTGEIYKIWLE